jgi:hypothetical protein
MASWELHHFYGGFGGKIIELFMGPMCRKAPTPQSPVSHQGSDGTCHSCRAVRCRWDSMMDFTIKHIILWANICQYNIE